MKQSFLPFPLAVATLLACGGAPSPPAMTATAPDAGAPGAAPAHASGGPSEEDAFVPIAADDAVWGSRTAPVTIVAFEDFQCPYCAKAAETLARVQKQYGPSTLRVVFKNLPLPFHKNARPAAEAAEGVRATGGNEAFWRFYTSAFAGQASLGAPSYAEWARAAGVDPAAIARGNPEWTRKIGRDLELAQKLGVDSTPLFLVNGEVVSGAQPLDVFVKTVDQELAKAKAAVGGGLPPEKVYAVLTEANLKEQASQAKEEEAPDTKIYKVPVGTSPVLGAKDAPVTIILFSDFQCPFCKAAEDTLAKVREKYGKDVRVVWKNDPLPFHPHAEPAAELALEARAEKGDAGFWAAHDALFASQPKLDEGDLEGIAAALKLDAAKVKQAILQHKYQGAIDDDLLVADEFGANGTPHFFIDGRRVAGAESLEVFSAMIDEELARARALAKQGTKPGAMYEALVRDGVGAADPKTVDVRPPAADAPARGAAKGLVVIQEFADFQCPFCRQAEETVDRLVLAYGTRVKVVWRNLPLPMHPDAELAAEAALEAQAQKGSAGFWKMHDLLFANQRVDGALQRPALDGYARELGLDMTKWAAALDGHAHQKAVEADAEAAKAAGIEGTPSFVVGTYALTGAQPYARFRQLVERSLGETAKPARPAK